MRTRTTIQRHMSDLKTLADLLGEVAARVPRRAEGQLLDAAALATVGFAVPKLTATCDALFATLAEESNPDIPARCDESASHGPMSS